MTGSAAVCVTILGDRGDERGSSFSVPEHWSRFLPTARDLHLTTLRPGHTRGNHFHARRREVIIVVHTSPWTLRWDEGPDTLVSERQFTGTGAVLLTVEPLAAHAVINTGTADLVTVGVTESMYDPAHPDTYPRPLASPRTL